MTTAWSAGFKAYGCPSVENLEQLKAKPVKSGHRVVPLMGVDAMDGDWLYVKSNIPVEELSEADLAWLREPQEGRWASQRYLGCAL